MVDFNDEQSSNPAPQKYLDLGGAKHLVNKIKELINPNIIDLTEIECSNQANLYEQQIYQIWTEINENNISNVILKLNIENNIVEMRPSSAIKLSDKSYVYSCLYVDGADINTILNVGIKIEYSDKVTINLVNS